MFDKITAQFLRRAFFLGGIQCFGFLILIGRMYYLQIMEGAYYHLLAEDNRIVTRALLPLRGEMCDRHGVPLAQNKMTFRLVFLTDKKDKLEKTLETLSTLIVFSEEEKEEALREAYKKRGLSSVILKENLTWEEVSAIELHGGDLPGISVEIGGVRTYPGNSVGAHVLGYVATPSEKEQVDDGGLTVPGMKVGKTGLEKHFDQRLRGELGYSAFEVNARRKVVRELQKKTSVPGETISLTLDGELQTYVQEALVVYPSAAAVVMDLQNGDILALASSPSFDPNFFPQGISHKEWNKLRDNPYVPLTNKVMAGRYPPGSTIKPLVALAALQAGVIDKNTTIHCPGHMYVGTHKFHCMQKGGHGSLNVSQAIAKSCDVFFYEVAKRVGIDRLSQVYQDFGIGSGGLEAFPNQKHGLVPTKTWKKEKKGADWTVSDTVQTSIGQGYMLSTPFELVLAMARLGAGGKKVIPRFEGTAPVSFEPMSYNPEYVKLVLGGMADVVNRPGGTAFRWPIPFSGFEMGGKTGTSQVRRITLQQRAAGQTKTHHLPWKYREHGLFVGYAPLQNPRYAVAVLIEHAGGSGPAVQVARDILLKTQLLERVSPS